MHTDGEPSQALLAQSTPSRHGSPSSSRQLALQPSPSLTLPSSHPSPFSTTPFPQPGSTHVLGSTTRSQSWPSAQSEASSQLHVLSAASQSPLSQALASSHG